MTRDPVTVLSRSTIKEASVLLVQLGITALPVLDEEGALCGVLSEADVLRDAFSPDGRTHLIPTHLGHPDDPARLGEVSQLMTREVTSVHEGTDVAAVTELMGTTGFKSLPVVDDSGHLVGVVSRSDLVKVRARADGVIAQEVDALLVSLGHTDWTSQVSDGRVLVEGPENPLDRSIAEVAAASVAGVISVRVG